MKMRKIYLIIALTALAVLPACQQLEPDVFDKSSSARIRPCQSRKNCI